MIWSNKLTHATVPLKGAEKGSGRNLIQEEKVETKAVGFKARVAVPLTLILSFNPHIQFFAYGYLLTFCRESKKIKSRSKRFYFECCKCFNKI